jgi:hypothetical protein
MQYSIKASAVLDIEVTIEASSEAQAFSVARERLAAHKDLWRLFLSSGTGRLVVHRESVREVKDASEDSAADAAGPQRATSP